MCSRRPHALAHAVPLNVVYYKKALPTYMHTQIPTTHAPAANAELSNNAYTIVTITT